MKKPYKDITIKRFEDNDILRAEDVNNIVDKTIMLEDRIAQLEAQGPRPQYYRHNIHYTYSHDTTYYWDVFFTLIDTNSTVYNTPQLIYDALSATVGYGSGTIDNGVQLAKGCVVDRARNVAYDIIGIRPYYDVGGTNYDWMVYYKTSPTEWTERNIYNSAATTTVKDGVKRIWANDNQMHANEVIIKQAQKSQESKIDDPITVAGTHFTDVRGDHKHPSESSTVTLNSGGHGGTPSIAGLIGKSVQSTISKPSSYSDSRYDYTFAGYSNYYDKNGNAISGAVYPKNNISVSASWSSYDTCQGTPCCRDLSVSTRCPCIGCYMLAGVFSDQEIAKIKSSGSLQMGAAFLANFSQERLSQMMDTTTLKWLPKYQKRMDYLNAISQSMDKDEFYNSLFDWDELDKTI